MINVFVVDDNETFRDGITFFIENILKYRVLGIATNGNQFLGHPDAGNADVVLMDIEMPGLNGIEAVKKFMWANRKICAIAITSYEEKAYLSELLGAGFKGCVFKKNIYEELESAIKTVLDKKIYYPRNMKIN